MPRGDGKERSEVMKRRELHSLSTRLASGIQKKGTSVECEGNALVDYELEAYWEHGKYFVEWRIQPRDARNSVWFAQAGIASTESDAVGSTFAFQAGATNEVPPGLSVFLLGTDRNVRPGMMLLLGVTGYVKVGSDPFKQFCFQSEQPAEG
jgi:hypothetical protein